MNITLFSLLGVVIGAVLQYIFTKHLDKKRYMRELRTNAYKDYLNGISRYSTVKDKEIQAELTSQILDAKGRICLYGSHHVIHSLANFERAGGLSGTAGDHDTYITLLTYMRKVAEGVGFARFEDIKDILNNTEL